MPVTVHQTMKAKRRETPALGKADVLVVEDESDIRELLRYNLARDGFAVTCAASGEEGLKAARTQLPDLIVLDLLLPGMDGLDLCRAIKSEPTTAAISIVMVTAKGEEADVVTGLELGADDYIIKPFSPRVLLARLKAVLRRRAAAEPDPDDDTFRLGPLVIYAQRFEAHVNGQPIDQLTRTEFMILRMLARRAGRVFTRAQILNEVQDEAAAVSDRSVDVHIVALRRKLGAAGVMLQTVRGVGYRMEEP
jgi:two-component system phosphate regulon response regulator PhoB